MRAATVAGLLFDVLTRAAMLVVLVVVTTVVLARAIAIDREAHDAVTVLPACQEDAVIVGYGAFEDGWWQHYECGPSLDDFAEPVR